MKTALKHYNRTTRQDFDQALKLDPFKDSVIASMGNRPDDAQDDARTPQNGRAEAKKPR
jgi:hypothetical protein